jgi:HEAT repeat protein
VLTLLLNLVAQDSREARKILDQCSGRGDGLAIHCLTLVALFDRQRAVDRLNALLGESRRLEAAETLVELGDTRGIPPLIELLDSPSDSERYLAFYALHYYTQEDIPYDADAPIEARRAAARQWRQWWQSAAPTFAVRTHAARIDIECCRE